jgi:ParB family transcriptional regulator, chromosome partitioning protein
MTNQIPLTSIDLTNTTFSFRDFTNIDDLTASISQHGQQVPVILRPHPTTDGKYQIVSGFRRISAISMLQDTSVLAIIREDLTLDQDAFKVSIIENEDRKSYNALD